MHTLAEMYQVKLRQAERVKKRKEAFQRALDHCQQQFCFLETYIYYFTIDNPSNDNEAIGDPFKTLFISRLSTEANESDLRREFEMYGPIERVRIVRHKDTGKSRGYAFIIFERERDMKGTFLLIKTRIISNFVINYSRL